MFSRNKVHLVFVELRPYAAVIFLPFFFHSYFLIPTLINSFNQHSIHLCHLCLCLCLCLCLFLFFFVFFCFVRYCAKKTQKKYSIHKSNHWNSLLLFVCTCVCVCVCFRVFVLFFFCFFFV